jgi:hypothetical protein
VDRRFGEQVFCAGSVIRAGRGLEVSILGISGGGAEIECGEMKGFLSQGMDVAGVGTLATVIELYSGCGWWLRV